MILEYFIIVGSLSAYFEFWVIYNLCTMYIDIGMSYTMGLQIMHFQILLTYCKCEVEVIIKLYRIALNLEVESKMPESDVSFVKKNAFVFHFNFRI